MRQQQWVGVVLQEADTHRKNDVTGESPSRHRRLATMRAYRNRVRVTAAAAETNAAAAMGIHPHAPHWLLSQLDIARSYTWSAPLIIEWLVIEPTRVGAEVDSTDTTVITARSYNWNNTVTDARHNDNLSVH
jgi:hypothetical protein